jgi:(p)ppGpp synthase/HD superfamily hydrolase
MPGMGAVEVAIMTDEMEGENRWGIVYAIQHGKEIQNYRPMAILTPSGGVRFLPESSTVLDAVASIQQESLLDKISEVEVNGKPARISDKVHAGDIVEVITGPNRLIPGEDWLTFCNEATARTLRSLLITGSLRKSAEQGRLAIRMILKEHGVLSLEDVLALESVKLDNLLEILGCASLEDLYIGVGGGAIRLQDLSKALIQVGIDRKELKWTTIHIVGSKKSNQPGVLASLTGLVSRSHGNIIRSVTNTLSSGDFELTILASNMDEKRRVSLTKAYQCCGLDLKWFEII